jgi:hypothetical protein
MIGPGKYDDLCTYVREQAKAAGVIVIVFEGEKGAGFSVQAPLAMQLQLPSVLRLIATQIENDLGGRG